MLRLASHPDLIISEEEFSLYIGSASNAANVLSLRSNNITVVLNVSDRIRYRRIDDGVPIQFYHVPLSDYGDSDLEEALPECFAVIDEARTLKKNVLVHCQGGVNRSPTAVIAYLMHAFRTTLQESTHLVQERRKCASPHENYMNQLVDYERQLFNGVTTVDPVEYSKHSLQAHLRMIAQTYSSNNNNNNNNNSINATSPTSFDRNNQITPSSSISPISSSSLSPEDSNTVSTIESKSTLCFSSIYAFNLDANADKPLSVTCE